jgi:drug/metabolite transporter (DMT)-like permease
MAILLILFVFFFWTALMVLIVGGIALWVFMLIDVLKRTNWHDENEKILWIVLLLVVGQIGAIAYYFAIYRERGKAIAAPAPPVATTPAAIEPPAPESPKKD